MGGGKGEQLTAEQRAQQTMITRQLDQIQIWGETQDQTALEQLKTDEKSRILQLQKQVNAEAAQWTEQTRAPAQAEQTAQGTPVQTLIPAKKSWKQKRAEEKMAKEARKNTPAGDLLTYRLREGILQLEKMRDSSLPMNNEDQLRRRGVDIRVVRSFLQGYQTGKKGQALNKAEEEKEKADERFVQAYWSVSKRPALSPRLQERSPLP